jgi:hypothetical protein
VHVDAGERRRQWGGWRQAAQARWQLVHAPCEARGRAGSPPQPSQRKPTADGRGASGLGGRPSGGSGSL